MEGNDETVLIALMMLEEDEEDEATKRRKVSEKQCWVPPLLQNREYVGAYHTTFQHRRAQTMELFFMCINCVLSVKMLLHFFFGSQFYFLVIMVWVGPIP